MNTDEIVNCFRKDSKLSRVCSGVFPVDRIPNLRGVPEGLIVNLDPHDKPGSHWVAIYIDKEGYGEFFDSFGRFPTQKPILSYLNKYSREWYANSKHLQSIFSAACGQYCIYYLYSKSRQKSMFEIVNKFGDSFILNDAFVTNWVNKTFNVKTTVFDVDFTPICTQTCCALCEK